jgi:hypothetical protein
MSEKIKLSGGLEKTVTWIWLDGGQLKVELYNFSETAQKLFGNDISHTITVEGMNRLFSTVNQSEETILAWMQQYFKSYFGIKQWLEENGVEFRIEKESWA